MPTHHRREDSVHSLLGTGALFGPQQQVDAFDIWTFAQDLLDEHFAEETGPAGDEYCLADERLRDAVWQMAEFVGQHGWLIVGKILLERCHFCKRQQL